MKEFYNKEKPKNIGKEFQSSMSKEEIIKTAIQYHSQGNIPEASKYYQFFINQGFKDHRIFHNSGEILKDLGRLKEAEIWIRRAILLKPNYAISYNSLGNILKAKINLKKQSLVIAKRLY